MFCDKYKWLHILCQMHSRYQTRCVIISDISWQSLGHKTDAGSTLVSTEDVHAQKISFGLMKNHTYIKGSSTVWKTLIGCHRTNDRIQSQLFPSVSVNHNLHTVQIIDDAVSRPTRSSSSSCINPMVLGVLIEKWRYQTFV